VPPVRYSRSVQRLSPGQRWVIGLGAFAVVCLVLGVVVLGFSGAGWGGVLVLFGLLHLGLTGLAGALVWTATPTLAPKPLLPTGVPVPGTVQRVFSYGTLRQPLVQEELFGGHVPTTPDALPGWRLEWVTITDPDVIRTSGSDRHPILRRGTPEDVVEGSALTLDHPWQLSAADRYEVADYQRIRVTLTSGWTAWVYVAADQA